MQLREWERGRQKDIEDVRALAALEQRKALRQQEANLAKQWTLDEERRQGTVKAAREAAMAELQHTHVQLAAGKHEVCHSFVLMKTPESTPPPGGARSAAWH